VAPLAGCGFQLRGALPLSPRLANVHLVAPDLQSPFYRSLDRSLATSGAGRSATVQGASAVVTIHADETGQRVLSVSARNTPREYEVYYTVEYSVAAAGTELLPRTSLTLTRDYSFDETLQLAKQREERVIREALAQDLAALVLRRLAALQ